MPYHMPKMSITTETQRTPRGKLSSLLCVLCVSVVVIAWFAPVFPVMDSKIVGDGGDNYQFLGFQFLAEQLFKAGGFPFGWTTYWRYPAGIHFQSATDSTLLTLAGLGLYPLFRNPVVVYNSSILLLLLLNVALSY